MVGLDDQDGLGPGWVGNKADWLAMGRRAALRILPGVVVDADESALAMRTKAEALNR